MLQRADRNRAIICNRNEGKEMLEYSFISGDPEQDFLTQNPELRYFPFVQKMINSTPELVNNIMWSLYLVEHPKAKIYYHVPMEQRIEIAENRYKVCYAEDCVPYRKEFCEASMHPHQLHYKLIYDAFQRQLWGFSSLEQDDILDALGKLEKVFKSIDVAEDKYVAEEKQIASFKGGAVAGGLFNLDPKETQLS